MKWLKELKVMDKQLLAKNKLITVETSNAQAVEKSSFCHSKWEKYECKLDQTNLNTKQSAARRTMAGSGRHLEMFIENINHSKLSINQTNQFPFTKHLHGTVQSRNT